MSDNKKFNRRSFLKALGLASASAAVPAVVSCTTDKQESAVGEPPVGKMTYRENPKTHQQVSLLGYGMMRLPSTNGKAVGRDNDAPIDQDMVNRQVDYALEHGVNYFDTSPAYCKGQSERATGIALNRHKRDEYFVATKLSNFSPETWTHDAGVAMFENSLKELQVDYVDYLLMHSVGNGSDDMDGWDTFNKRYIENGLLDYLVAQREAGKIRNLGFSYHGDIRVFDWLLSQHDKYHWDFVQIQLNYIDWKHAKDINDRNTNAEYLYNELDKREIPVVIMEPLLGGRLANLPDGLVAQLKTNNPTKSVASWAFRYAGSFPRVLTVLSGMTFMEHLKENLCTMCPLEPVTDEEKALLESIAVEMLNYNTIPCNDCKYCMPCPYGVDIPAIFVHYNKCLTEGTLTRSTQHPNFAESRRKFLVGYDRSVPRLRQADHCVGCGHCEPECPQRIRIPREMQRISQYTDALKRGNDQGLNAATTATTNS